MLWRKEKGEGWRKSGTPSHLKTVSQDKNISAKLQGRMHVRRFQDLIDP